MRISLKDGIILGETKEDRQKFVNKIKEKAQIGVQAEICRVSDEIVENIVENFDGSDEYDRIIGAYTKTILIPAVKQRLEARKDEIANKVVNYVVKNLEFEVG